MFPAITAPKPARYLSLQPAGAASAGVDPGPWVNLGACIGEAFKSRTTSRMPWVTPKPLARRWALTPN
ncbi:MAG: hypothetical protein CM15mP103_02990 [Gammaproteobacteria bacterium]|nr:MAG: hypothetical protein CM15mP103_02990 [Gammaproteobacteria bacterium]